LLTQLQYIRFLGPPLVPLAAASAFPPPPPTDGFTLLVSIRGSLELDGRRTFSFPCWSSLRQIFSALPHPSLSDRVYRFSSASRGLFCFQGGALLVPFFPANSNAIYMVDVDSGVKCLSWLRPFVPASCFLLYSIIFRAKGFLPPEMTGLLLFGWRSHWIPRIARFSLQIS